MDRKAFDKKLEFDINLIAHEGNDSWINRTLEKIKNCLDDNKIPEANENCDHCSYWNARNKLEQA